MVDVMVDEVGFDEAAGVTTMQVMLKNRSDRSIYPPLALKVREVVAGPKNVAANPDPESKVTGAEWDFSTLLGAQGRLDPGMISEPRVVKLRTSAAQGRDVILDYDVIGRAATGR